MPKKEEQIFRNIPNTTTTRNGGAIFKTMDFFIRGKSRIINKIKQLSPIRTASL